MNTNEVRRNRVHLPGLGMETRVLESGSGPPVVFLHGNPDNADEWLAAIALLSDRYRCIAPDLPGYGEAPEPPKSFDYGVAAQVAFLDAVLAAVGVSEKLILVVHDIVSVVGADAIVVPRPDGLSRKPFRGHCPVAAVRQVGSEL